VGKRSLNLNHVLGPKVKDIVVFRTEVGTVPSSGHVDFGGPSRGDGGATVGVELLKSFNPIFKRLHQRDPFDIGSGDLIHGFVRRVERGRITGRESVGHG
jgi:hypothetical protein